MKDIAIMQIGELARLTRTTPRALRLYEARGLLGPVPRRGRYRHYHAGHAAQVRLVRQALALGLRMADLARLPQHTGADALAQAAALLQARRAQVQRELQRLRAQDDALAALEHALLHCPEADPTGKRPLALDCAPA
ncbi:MerR family transcriptional regulator [Acidovorax lacteus]